MKNKLFFIKDWKFFLLEKNLKMFKDEKIEEVLYELERDIYIPIIKRTEDRKGFKILKDNANRFKIDTSKICDVLFVVF